MLSGTEFASLSVEMLTFLLLGVQPLSHLTFSIQVELPVFIPVLSGVARIISSVSAGCLSKFGEIAQKEYNWARGRGTFYLPPLFISIPPYRWLDMPKQTKASS